MGCMRGFLYSLRYVVPFWMVVVLILWMLLR